MSARAMYPTGEVSAPLLDLRMVDDEGIEGIEKTLRWLAKQHTRFTRSKFAVMR